MDLGSITDVIKEIGKGSLGTMDNVLDAMGSGDMGSFYDTGAKMWGSLRDALGS
ncbi:hypothetical protein [Tomitella fengzijianii]|uniref:hypothetical protein n=1 Tax=Tomitella fengzijianii TaxID=2597660 RepID=UPI00131E3E34|nr:hypothetical protein [Tomitella fengzijianii]